MGGCDVDESQIKEGFPVAVKLRKKPRDVVLYCTWEDHEVRKLHERLEEKQTHASEQSQNSIEFQDALKVLDVEGFNVTATVLEKMEHDRPHWPYRTGKYTCRRVIECFSSLLDRE